LHFAPALLALAVAGLAQDSAPKPYHDARKTPLSYNGPGRDDPEPKDVQEVRLAYFGPPDPLDEAGGQMWQGASLAIEEANRQGGYRGLPFRLIPVWDPNPWAGGVAKLARAVYSDKVWAIIGGIDGATTHLAEQVVAKAQLTLVNPAATDRSIHTASVPWMFSCAPGDHLLAAAVSDELRERARRFALVSAIDHDSRAFVTQLKLAFVRDRLSPVLHLEWPGGTEDRARIARELDAAAPDAIVVVAVARETMALIKAIREAGFAGLLLSGPSIARADPDPRLNGVLYPALGDIPLAFQTKFPTRYGRRPDYTAAHAYDAANIVIAAIRTAGLNRPRIRDAVRSLSPTHGVTGVIEWDDQGQNQRAVPLRVFMSTARSVDAGSGVQTEAEASRAVSPELKRRIDLGPDLYLRQIGNGAYVIGHVFPFLSNSLLVEMADGTFVMAGTPCTPDATQRVLDWIKRQFGARKVVAIDTGYHVDNLGGNRALLSAGIAVYGSDLTVKLLKDRGEQTRLTTLKLIGGKDSPTYAVHATMEFVPPDHVFPIQDGLKLSFGGEDVRVFYPGPSQAPDKVAVYFPARKLLFGSCMILAGDRAGNTTEADIEQWPIAIRRLKQFPVDVVVPGHGERLDPGLIQHTLDLLEKK
jgi:ABC-type branched-subunit amino acid transport system substrate-binding protein/glyoxylase-like metal-dependent hydrolase (beta-lactamase superfamily II)